MPSTRALLVLLSLATPCALAAQVSAVTAARPAIEVLADRPVSAAGAPPLVEPHLSADPRDPRRLVAAAMAPRTPDNQDIGCLVFASRDGGATWTSTDLGMRGPTACADPWTAWAPDGAAVLLYLADSGLVVRRSADGGHRWPAESLLVRGPFDHPMMTAAPARAGEPAALWIVSALSIRNARAQRRSSVWVARSRDGGRTFEERARWVPTNLSQEAITPVVLGDGTLVVGTIDHHDASDRRLERRRAWVARAGDDGAAFSEPMMVTESCTRTRMAAWPSLATSPGARADSAVLHFTCEADGNRGILYARSVDGGNRWTAVRRIDGGPDSTWTKTATMAVASDGTLAVTWVDGRGADRAGAPIEAAAGCAWLYGTVSRDGGLTFAPPTRLSAQPSCPTAAATGAAVLQRFPSGGEYHGLVATAAGEFVAVWPDARDGRFRLRTVRFRAR